jgi:hypothetical protein
LVATAEVNFGPFKVDSGKGTEFTLGQPTPAPRRTQASRGRVRTSR